MPFWLLVGGVSSFQLCLRDVCSGWLCGRHGPLQPCQPYSRSTKCPKMLLKPSRRQKGRRRRSFELWLPCRWPVAAAVAEARMSNGGKLTVIQAMQVGLVYRAARRSLFIQGGGNPEAWVDPNPWGGLGFHCGRVPEDSRTILV